MSQQSRSPIDYESSPPLARRVVSPAERWTGIVLIIVLAMGALWVGLFLLHWFSLGDMGH
jgi:hypothetical protein